MAKSLISVIKLQVLVGIYHGRRAQLFISGKRIRHWERVWLSGNGGKSMETLLRNKRPGVYIIIRVAFVENRVIKFS